MNAFLASPQRIAIALGVALLLALVVILLLPADLPTARSLKPQELVWNLPVPATVESDAAISAIQQRRLWGAPAGAATGGALATAAAADEKALTPPDWRVAGVFSEGGQRALLIATQGEPQPRTLRVGDSLPGDAKILAIEYDRVVALLNGRRVSLSTFPQ